MSNENTVTKWNEDIHSKEVKADTTIASGEEVKKFHELEEEYNELLQSIDNLISKQISLVHTKGVYDRMIVVDILKRCKIN